MRAHPICNFLLTLLLISTTSSIAADTKIQDLINDPKTRRILHQPLFPAASSSPPPLVSEPIFPTPDHPFFPEVPTVATPDQPQQQVQPIQPNGTPVSGTSPIATQPTNPTKKLAIAVSVGIVTLGMLSALGFYIYKHRAKHPDETQKLVGSNSFQRANEESRMPPSNFLYIGTVEPSSSASQTQLNQSNNVANNASPYRKLSPAKKSDRYRPSPELQPLPPLRNHPRVFPPTIINSPDQKFHHLKMKQKFTIHIILVVLQPIPTNFNSSISSSPPPPPPPPPLSTSRKLGGRVGSKATNSIEPSVLDRSQRSSPSISSSFKSQSSNPTPKPAHAVSEKKSRLEEQNRGAIHDTDARDESKPRLKPLHWDKVRATSERATVWDQLKSSSFQLNEDMMESLFGCNSVNSVPNEVNKKSVRPPVEKQNRDATQELKNSRLFLKLLEAVLRAGNRMNVGTNRGDARAFKLETLLKLIDIKGTDGKTTLLHFVVQEIIRSEGLGSDRKDDNNLSNLSNIKFKEDEFKKQGLQVVAGLSRELGSAKKAAGMDSNVLSGYVLKLEAGLVKVRSILQYEKKGMEGNFFESMEVFLKEAEDGIVRVKAEERKALSMVKEVTEYFHGDAAKEEAHPLRIFMIVRDFVCILDSVCKDVGMMQDRTVVGAARSFRIATTASLPVLNRYNVRQDRSWDDDSSSP
ncbi:unnamed protein product [Withania somnifera]